MTSEQVVALAPDPASAKAGAALATPGKWSEIGRDAESRIVWGACQGSGAKPYQVRVDLGAPAFQCTCPSRKFPCKHALGLLLLLAGSPDHVPVSHPPASVREWLDSREQRAEKKAEKQGVRASRESAADPDAQRERAAAREAKVAHGLAELALWLRDLIRSGLGTAQNRPAMFWDDMAARLVDAQAPGVARLVRALGVARTTGEDWPERMLLQIARLHLLVESHQRLNSLPPVLRAVVRARIGWTLSDAELSLLPRVGDRWIVIGQMLLDDETLRARRTWLLGATTGRTALLLHFAHAKAPFAESLPPVGSEIAAELTFFPGDVYRATIRTRDDAMPRATTFPSAAPGLREATGAFADALARDPWTEQVPLVVQNVVPVLRDGRWFIRDDANNTVPLSARFRAPWHLLALSGAYPAVICGEWDGEHLYPLSIGLDGALVPLDSLVDR